MRHVGTSLTNRCTHNPLHTTNTTPVAACPLLLWVRRSVCSQPLERRQCLHCLNPMYFQQTQTAWSVTNVVNGSTISGGIANASCLKWTRTEPKY
jgi:hypothetical protein